MGSTPCWVEHDLMARDAREAEDDRDAARVNEILDGIRESILAALLTGDAKQPVRCLNRITTRVDAQTLELAMGDVCGYDEVDVAIQKALAADHPAAKAARDAIAKRYVEQYEGWL
jgi:hypothetical protein